MKRRWLQLCCAILLLSLTGPVAAQQPEKDQAGRTSALVRLLQSKGILTREEAASVVAAETQAEVEERLARLLLDKGLISQTDYDNLASSSLPAASPSGAAAKPTIVAWTGGSGAVVPPEPSQASLLANTPSQEKRGMVAAFAPIRTLPLAGEAAFKRDGLAPVIRIGPDIKMKPYGMFKASFISDSSSPGGNDFPLPGFLGDSGPGNSAEVHFSARSSRMGADFEWLDRSRSLTITGKVEADFEGNFSRVNNRNVSTIRSPALQLRLAWVRLDKKVSDNTSWFGLFGQDWTAFGSSTLPPLIETTAMGLGYGILYERAPQFRFGVGQNLGGDRHWKFEPEFALVMAGFGNLPADVSNQLAFGERQGADSNRPEVQGRLVTQFQLDPAPGVAPAQLIASGTYGSREAIVTAASVPTAFKAAFPQGATVTSDRYGFSAEAQLPTRYFTLLLKAFTGQDLRFYLVGNLFSNFNDVSGLTGTATASSIDAASSVVFGLNSSGVPTVAPQRPVRTRGGFADIGFPLSRIFNANPEGRNNGWTLNFHYSLDDALARDVRRISPANRSRDDIFAGTLTYKLNQYFSLAYEESYYRTRAAEKGGPLPLFRGIPSYQWHDVRQQLSIMTTF